MSNFHLKQHASSERGFTMIEVLISMFILAIGILGASALQLTSFNANLNGLYRTQAIFLANDIIDRMRRDPITARTGVYDKVDSSKPSTGTNGCSSATGCSPTELAANDIAEWVNYFKRDEPLLPNGTGTIQQNGNIFTITITWNEKDTLSHNNTTSTHVVDIQI